MLEGIAPIRALNLLHQSFDIANNTSCGDLENCKRCKTGFSYMPKAENAPVQLFQTL
jgi:hypothetical protein